MSLHLFHDRLGPRFAHTKWRFLEFVQIYRLHLTARRAIESSLQKSDSTRENLPTQRPKKKGSFSATHLQKNMDFRRIPRKNYIVGSTSPPRQVDFFGPPPGWHDIFSSVRRSQPKRWIQGCGVDPTKSHWKKQLAGNTFLRFLGEIP